MANLKHIAFAAIANLALVVSAQAQPATAPDDRAMQWLTLIDNGNYAQGYTQMGTAAQAHVAADAAARQFKSEREPLGAMANRALKDVQLNKTAPDMPAGQYAVVRFDSIFAHKAAAVETVTLAMTQDNWSVVGYRIQ